MSGMMLTGLRNQNQSNFHARAHMLDLHAGRCEQLISAMHAGVRGKMVLKSDHEKKLLDASKSWDDAISSKDVSSITCLLAKDAILHHGLLHTC